MWITKSTHACVRLEQDRRVLVIDPGEWSELDALEGADAVLVTHQHDDHVDPLRLAGLGVPVFAPMDAEIDGPAITRVRSGQEFTAAGFHIRPVGARHAATYAGQPGRPSTADATDPRRDAQREGPGQRRRWIGRETDAGFRHLAPGETA